MPIISPAEGRRPPIEAWWKKGIKEKTVSEILDVGVKLDEYQSDCVFALAALKVLHHPKHPKHFAFWGRDPAQKTAERVQKVIDLSPCPIESPVGWLGIPENLWLVDGLQASLFPTKKEGKKVDNGMLLRKRKAQANASAAIHAQDGATAVLEERPRKRTRTAKAHEKEVNEQAELPAAPLPEVIEAPAASAENNHTDKATKLELIGVELPPTGTVEVEQVANRPANRHHEEPSPEPTRRSARQAKKNNPAVSTASTPMTELGSLPETLSPMSSAPASVDEQRPPITRARSSSSSSGSSTAVSDAGSGGDTAVEPDSNELLNKGKGKAKQEDDTDAVDNEKAPIRTSGRVRKPAKKVLHVDEEPTLSKKATAMPPPESKRARTKRS